MCGCHWDAGGWIQWPPTQALLPSGKDLVCVRACVNSLHAVLPGAFAPLFQTALEWWKYELLLETQVCVCTRWICRRPFYSGTVLKLWLIRSDGTKLASTASNYTYCWYSVLWGVWLFNSHICPSSLTIKAKCFELHVMKTWSNGWFARSRSWQFGYFSKLSHVMYVHCCFLCYKTQSADRSF